MMLSPISSSLLPIPSDAITEECWTNTIIHILEVPPDLGFELDLKGRGCGKGMLFLVGTLAVALCRTVLNMLIRQGGLWVQGRARRTFQMFPCAAQGCCPRHVLHQCFWERHSGNNQSASLWVSSPSELLRRVSRCCSFWF